MGLATGQLALQLVVGTVFRNGKPEKLLLWIMSGGKQVTCGGKKQPWQQPWREQNSQFYCHKALVPVTCQPRLVKGLSSGEIREEVLFKALEVNSGYWLSSNCKAERHVYQ